MGEYYRIVRDDVERLYSPSETVYVSVKVYDTSGNLVSPTTGVKLYVYNPCGSLVETITMDEDATGEYSAKISSLPAKLGKYILKFEASDGTYTNYLSSFLVVLPFTNMADRVRYISGVHSKKQINDEELAFIILESMYEAYRDVYLEIYEKPLSNPTTGAFCDGTNKLFQVSSPPIADITGDEEVLGYGESSCATDVTAYWIDEDGEYHDAKVEVVSDIYGTINITQLDGTAIPSSYKKLVVHYWSRSEYFNYNVFYDAVAYLSAHKLLERMRSLTSVTLADVSSNLDKQRISPRMFYKVYRSLIKKIGKPVMGGV